MAAKRPRISTNKLNILDFSLGIRAGEINDNFDLIRYWIESERLRIGGWGLVEGFELTKDLTNFSIHVSEGLLINEYGEEIEVPEHTFHVGPPQYPETADNITETLTADNTGLIKLSYPIYSNTKHKVINYMAGDGQDFTTDVLTLRDVDTNQALSIAGDVEWIEETYIKLTSRWAHREIRIEYLYAADRIDAIFVKNDGSEYKDPMPVGIISTSPSQQVVQDYFNDGWYLIGFAYWHVGREIDVEFFTGDRTLRKVFVDKNNVLYLNGKPYREKTVIYFEEPKPPQENDLWYDVVTEILYIWRPNEDGEYEWQPVNDLARGITEVYQFSPEENPDDLQTFDFNSQPKLFFMPGKHQITVIVDQVVVMEDQYEELYYDKDEVERLKAQARTEEAEDLYASLQKNLTGYGIKFTYPLERPSIVEIRISHDLNTRKHETDVFQHDCVFLKTDSQTVASASTLTYSVGCEYESGMAQLEIYKNGIRLINDVHYKEVQRDGSYATEPGQLCNRFKLLAIPNVGDILDFRVLRQMSSYANLKAIIKEFEDEVTACQTQVANIQEEVAEATEEFRRQNTSYGQRLTQTESDIISLQSGKMNADIRIAKANLDASIYNGIVSDRIEMTKQANAFSIFLNNVAPTDFVQITYALTDESAPILLLPQRGDYVLEATTDGSNLRLNGKWLNTASAKLYINGFKIGV